MAIPNYIVSINKGKREKKGKKIFLYDSAINIRIILYLLTKKETKGKEKGKKGKNLFCFVCMYHTYKQNTSRIIMILLVLIYMCLCLVIKMNCMYT